MQNRCGQTTAQYGDQKSKSDTKQSGNGNTLFHFDHILSSEISSQTDAEAIGKALDKAKHKIDNDAGAAHRGQRLGTQGLSHNDGICQGIKELKDITADDGKGKTPQNLEGIAFGQIVSVESVFGETLFLCFGYFLVCFIIMHFCFLQNFLLFT